jgi:hypothetical protein
VLPGRDPRGGESLVRNLLLGRRVCRRFGVDPSGAGYLPDSFGHPAQLPQILAGFGIGTFLFSRGMGDEIDDVGVVFRWRAGPAEVVACQMLPHYDNFARLSWYQDAEERCARSSSGSASSCAAGQRDLLRERLGPLRRSIRAVEDPRGAERRSTRRSGLPSQHAPATAAGARGRAGGQ